MASRHFIADRKFSLLRYIDLCKLNNAWGQLVPEHDLVCSMILHFFNVIERVEIILEDADEQIILSLIIDPVLRKVKLSRLSNNENVPSLKCIPLRSTTLRLSYADGFLFVQQNVELAP